MNNLKAKKYLLLDLDGVCYGKHNNYSLERVFGQVSKRMTQFISEKLKIDKDKAKELQTNYFYKYNTSLRGLMIHDGISPDEFLSFVHDIDLSFMKADKIMRGELERLNMEKFIFTNGSADLLRITLFPSEAFTVDAASSLTLPPIEDSILLCSAPR